MHVQMYAGSGDYIHSNFATHTDGLTCSFTDADGCTHFFYVGETILVEDDRGIYTVVVSLGFYNGGARNQTIIRGKRLN